MAGPDRKKMTENRKARLRSDRRPKGLAPSKGNAPSSGGGGSSFEDLLAMMPIDTLEERIRKSYGPDAPKRTGAGGEELPPGLKKGGKVEVKRGRAYKGTF
jgi:hypothetical protein